MDPDRPFPISLYCTVLKTIYFFEEFDQKEAAEKLGITQGAFSKRLSKALEQLKSMLGEDFLFD